MTEVKILCNDCTSDELYDFEGETYVDEARNPTRKPGEDDIAILAAPTLRDVNPIKLLRARRMICEECGKTVYVAPSSQWLLDLKAGK